MGERQTSGRSRRPQGMKEDPLLDMDEMIDVVSSVDGGESSVWAAPVEVPVEPSVELADGPIDEYQLEEEEAPSPFTAPVEQYLGEKEEDAPSPSAVCPYLGVSQPSDRHMAQPSATHRCFGQERPYPIVEAHQQQYCLTPEFTACQVYLAWHAVKSAPAARGRGSLRELLSRLFGGGRSSSRS